jgi:hypothetical protein
VEFQLCSLEYYESPGAISRTTHVAYLL